MKPPINRMDPEGDIDHLIRDDRTALLDSYRSPEKGRKRAAALFAVIGSETARGATGFLASGLSAAQGIWIATALIGLVGVGLVVSEAGREDGSEPDGVPAQVAQPPQMPAAAEPPAPTVVPPTVVEPSSPQPERDDRSPADRAPSAPSGVVQRIEPAQTEPQEPTVDRHEEVRTRATIEFPDQQPK